MATKHGIFYSDKNTLIITLQSQKQGHFSHILVIQGEIFIYGNARMWMFPSVHQKHMGPKGPPEFTAPIMMTVDVSMRECPQEKIACHLRILLVQARTKRTSLSSLFLPNASRSQWSNFPQAAPMVPGDLVNEHFQECFYDFAHGHSSFDVSETWIQIQISSSHSLYGF